ncbi:hypothetical protein WN55_10051 [Dufourea novaeangliae]|uniref:Uncharacterized protein n=1 Tax=Dufourea novaeangliae TaxID=178035 RepID=A0A154PAG3_DUFNO|nr:hypothetical protein WN55_10051 [Dufourea novaeangliae]
MVWGSMVTSGVEQLVFIHSNSGQIRIFKYFKIRFNCKCVRGSFSVFVTQNIETNVVKNC